MHCRSLWRGSPVTGSAALGLCFGQRGACALPHPDKAYRGGEDAFVAHDDGIGVADGVGGYARHGIDPARYTRHLMQCVLKELQKRTESHTRDFARRLLERAFAATQLLGQPGGCPVTLAAWAEARVVSVCHLGDCGLLQVRGDALVYHTQPQQHAFNCPYQLPDDPPSSGVQAELAVCPGDVFLCASDGVFDNVELDALVRCVADVGQRSCAEVAHEVGARAMATGKDPRCCSPFARHAAESGYKYKGGKLDDVTVVVARATPRETMETETCPALITELLGLPPDAPRGER